MNRLRMIWIGIVNCFCQLTGFEHFTRTHTINFLVFHISVKLEKEKKAIVRDLSWVKSTKSSMTNSLLVEGREGGEKKERKVKP